MKTKFSTAAAVAGAGFAFCVLSGAVPVTFTEDFNNNAVSGARFEISVDGFALGVISQRLEVNGNGPPGFAALEVKHWGANFRRDFQISFDYKLDHVNPGGDKTIFLGVGLALAGKWPQTITGVACGLLQDSDGLSLCVIERIGGLKDDFNKFLIPQTSGTITIEWDKSADRLTVRRNAQSVSVDGLYAKHGAAHGLDPMVISLGASTTGGNIFLNGSRTRVDNFEFHGVKRQR